AEQDAAPVVVPMSQLMPDRKTAALGAAAAVDRDDRLPRRAHDRGVAAVEGTVFDEGTAAPRDGLEINFRRIRNAEPQEGALGGGDRLHFSPSSSSSPSNRSSLARSSSIPSMSLSEGPWPFLAAINILDASSGSRARIFSNLARAASRSNPTTLPFPARQSCSSAFARSNRHFAASVLARAINESISARHLSGSLPRAFMSSRNSASE